MMFHAKAVKTVPLVFALLLSSALRAQDQDQDQVRKVDDKRAKEMVALFKKEMKASCGL